MIAGAACLMFWLSLLTEVQGTIFDVKKFGAKADGKSDDCKAFASAWKAACSCMTPSTLVIPKGEYMVAQLMFQGPCRAPVTYQLQGTLKAPTVMNKMNSQDGWLAFLDIDGLTVLGGGTFDGQGSAAWASNNCAKTGKCNSLPANLRITKVTNSKIQDITSLNSKLFHMNILGCKNLTLQHITITAPENSLNTDGIHIGRSSGINITDANIQTGDDCVSLGDGSQQVNVEKVTCGPGHGISIGSLGKYRNEQPVVGVTVRNCTLTNTMNGVRVKTWPASPSGVASNMHFEDIIMNNVSNPILIDQEYCPYGQCQTKVPSRIRISDVSFKNIRGTSATELAVKLVCSRGLPCQKVGICDVNLTYNGNGAATSECANVKPTISGKQFPPVCTRTT
ncbi:hypothetical protein Pint_01891 [Pistacia integerrima]|uniref:Uncharacterized protein n=1 Tax=Pistacia integerrima TaxID=434235 RepID=A0ACC0ZK02_9ROSI|nr:hypothetical protein Pint_01891 [Pistacia integerrima]